MKTTPYDVGTRVTFPTKSFLSDGEIIKAFREPQMYIVKLDEKAPNEYAWDTDEILAFPADITPLSPKVKTYITSPGESIAGIAIRELGDEEKWSVIRDINNEKFPYMSASSYYPVGSRILLPV